jgi:acyl transferase domain-containing protein
MSPVYASESPRNTSASAAADVTAIVGLACRVPGAMNASKLWENLAAQRDVQQKIPPERFNVDAFFHPDGSKKGTVSRPRSIRASSGLHAGTAL